MAYGYSAVLPLQQDTEDGFYVLTKTLAENIKQNFKNLLLTSPGERVMIPDFGVGLRDFLFSNVGSAYESEIVVRVEDQVEKFMPFLVINDINFFRIDPPYEGSANRNTLDIQIYYSVPQFNFNDMLKVTKISLE